MEALSYTITTGVLYNKLNVELNVVIRGDSLTFTEQLVLPQKSITLTARILAVTGVDDFMKAAKTSLENFEEYLLARQEKKLLDIEHLQFLCERHRLSYKITGSKPVTIYRAYIQELNDTKWERKVRGASLCFKARNRIHGNKPGIPRNIPQAIELLRQAISIDYTPAYGHLAALYLAEGRTAVARELAETGRRLGDGESMMALARIISVESENPDYNKVAELYISAAERGYYRRAGAELRRLITEGHYTPKSDRYMKLVVIAARQKELNANEELRDSFFDPLLQEGHDLLNSNHPDYERSRKVLFSALDKGVYHAYSDITKSYISEHRWGQAAHFALKGIDAGINSCLIYAARLALLGADFSEFTDELGSPDYNKAAQNALECIDRDMTAGFKILNHLIDNEKMGSQQLPEDIRNRLEHFNAHMPADSRADIYCAPFDGEKVKR